mmetsp:Transcript_31464/g.50712  ORF Transcript_31464/g.50712 Transcript_31464/m.50712 type:complete len:273 (-) Transcript_31464:124-942(-)
MSPLLLCRLPAVQLCQAACQLLSSFRRRRPRLLHIFHQRGDLLRQFLHGCLGPPAFFRQALPCGVLQGLQLLLHCGHLLLRRHRRLLHGLPQLPFQTLQGLLALQSFALELLVEPSDGSFQAELRRPRLALLAVEEALVALAQLLQAQQLLLQLVRRHLRLTQLGLAVLSQLLCLREAVLLLLRLCRRQLRQLQLLLGLPVVATGCVLGQLLLQLRQLLHTLLSQALLLALQQHLMQLLLLHLQLFPLLSFHLHLLCPLRLCRLQRLAQRGA